MTEWRFKNETAAVNTLTPITVGWRIATSGHSKSRTTAALDSASLGVQFLQDTFSIKKRSSSLAEVNLNDMIDSMSICSMKPSDDRKHDRLKDDVYVDFGHGGNAFHFYIATLLSSVDVPGHLRIRPAFSALMESLGMKPTDRPSSPP